MFDTQEFEIKFNCPQKQDTLNLKIMAFEAEFNLTLPF